MNINIDELVKKAVDIIKNKCKLPDNGFLSGSSLANTIYNLLHDIEIKFDDIDVFVLKELVEDRYSLNFNNFFIQSDIKKKLVEPDSGYPSYITKIGDYFFSIESSCEDGILNTIYYYSNTEKPFFVDGFDLNCTQVSYDLKTNEIHYTKEFEHFLLNKDIKICNLKTPNNTIIRYLKKCKDLKIKPIKDNLDMVYCYIKYSDKFFIDTRFKLFKEKNYEKYKLNKEILNKYFIVKEEKKNSSNENLYKFILNETAPINKEKYDKLFDKENKIPYNNLDCWRFPKFWENALDNSYEEKIYKELGEFIDNEKYIDVDNASIVDINILSALVRSSSKITYNLLGFKLSEQIKLVNLFFERFYDNQITAYTILHQNKFKKINFSENELKVLGFKTIRKRKTNYITSRFNYFKETLFNHDNKKQKSEV